MRLVWLVALCAVALPQASAQSGARTVSDDRGQFSIDVPADWTAGPLDAAALTKLVPAASRPRTGGNASGIFAIGPGVAGGDPAFLFVTAVPLARSATPADPARLAETLLDAPRAPGLQVMREGSATVARLRAHYVYAFASAPETGKALYTIMVFMEASGTGFYAYGAIPDEPGRIHTDFATISATFETLRPTPPSVQRPPRAPTATAPAATAPPSTATENPAAGVFRIFAVPRAPRGRFEASGGTAFFISPDGTAVTNSHVVYEANVNPDYELVALVGGEFYGASLVCASVLSHNPWTNPSSPVQLERDVAEIRLTAPPANFPFGSLHMPGATSYGLPHQGPLPTFPALRFGKDPVVGQSVYFVGYGVTIGSSPFPASTAGIVRKIETASDGTPIFSMSLKGSAVRGDSGSPVFDTRGEVVGLLGWTSDAQHNFGFAMTRGALDPVCR